MRLVDVRALNAFFIFPQKEEMLGVSFTLLLLLVCCGRHVLAARRPTGSGNNVPSRPTPTATFDVRNYGAVGDGLTMNTAAFAKAIAAATANPGGGLVYVAAGRYLTGTVQLLNNTYLNVNSDAVILGSPRESDYIWGAAGLPVVIYAEGVSNIGIVGAGILDGQAIPHFIAGYSAMDDEFIPVMWTGPPRNCSGECRPRLVQFIGCNNILVRDVTLQNSPDWTSHYYNCANVLIQNITVFGDHRWPNNDGIDPDSSVNITIDGVSVDTGDDGVCPKTDNGAPLSNLLVTNSVLRSRSSAFKLGSATIGDMSDILVENIFVWDSNRALGVQHRDQGSISNVEFRNIVIDGTYYNPVSWWGAGEGLWVTTIPRCIVGCAIPGSISDIRFINVTSRRSTNGAFFGSRSGTPIRGLLLQDVSYHVDDWRAPPHTDLLLSPPEHDYRPTSLGDRILGNTDVFYFEGVDVASSKMNNCKGSFGKVKRSWWADCLGGDQVPNSNFTCQL